MAQGWDFDPSSFVGLVEKDLVKYTRILGMAMLREIVIRSPVGNPDLWKGKPPPGYVGGAFRANNQVSIGEPIYTYTDEIDNDGQSTIAKGQAALAKANPYSIIYIQNNRPYAERLESGDHSKQAPEGIYAVSFHGVSQAYK